MTTSPLITTATATTFTASVIDASQQHLVLVDFWAAWCAPCRQLIPLLEKLVHEYAGQVLLVKIDTDAEQTLAARFGIRSLPTVQLFHSGRVVDQFLGAIPETQIRALIERHRPRASTQLLTEARQQLAAHDLAAAAALIAQVRELEPQAKGLFAVELEWHLANGDYAAATEMIERTPLELATAPEIIHARAQLHFATIAAAAPPIETLLSQPTMDSQSRYQLAAYQVMTGQFAAAIDQLLTLMQQDRRFNDEAARKSLVLLFDLLGPDHALVTPARVRMARLLF